MAELRKAQLAVMGRLVPQDPNDPPASELLKEIEAEKSSKYWKEKKVKQLKSTPVITPEIVPFRSLETWKWVRVSDLAESIDYGTSQKTCDDQSAPVYRMGNIVDGILIDQGF